MSAVQSPAEVQSGLEGVVAFATEIAEPDKEGGALRYRGVDIENLVGAVPYEQVWGLLVDGRFKPGLPPAEPHALTVRSGDHRVDVQSALAMLAPEWGFGAADRHHRRGGPRQPRARLGDGALVRGAVGARRRPAAGAAAEIDQGRTIPERFLIRWRGEANPDHVKAIDAYWISAAEHGMNASTFTARVIASTGADVAAALSGAVGALSGPLHGGAPSRVLKMLEEVEADGRRRALGLRRARPRRPPDGLRPPHLPRRRPARAGAAPHLPRTRLAPLRGRRGAREGGAGRAAGAPARPRAGHQRGVLVGRHPRPRGSPAGPVHADVHLRARGRLVGAHPRAEARGEADPPDRQVRRRGPRPLDAE